MTFDILSRMTLGRFTDPDTILVSAGGNYNDTNLIPSNVLLGVNYGIDEVGTATGGSILTPIISINENLLATISNSETTYTNFIIINRVDNSKWHTIGNRIGNGTLQISGLAPGNYYARVISVGSPGTVSDYTTFTVSGDALISGVNYNWGRWIYASICKYFNTNKGDYTMFIEGQEKDTSALTEWFELRVDGPYYSQVNQGYWDCYIEINTIFTLTNRADTYEARRIADYLASLFNTINCYRYGSGIYDDNSFLGCLLPVDGYRERLQISQFGVMPNAEVQQGSIERHYKMELVEE